MSDAREDLEAAYTQLEAAQAPAVEVAAPAPETEAVEAAPEESEAAPVKTDGRDEKGRFATKAEKAAATPATASAAPPEATEATEAPAPEALKAPSNWRAGAKEKWAALKTAAAVCAKEKWAALPPEIQEEALRVDLEVRKVMQDAAPAKRFAQEFGQVLAPYAQQLQSQGVNPAQHVGQLLQASRILTSGAPAAKAQFVAQLIRNSGIPIEMLAQHLDGQAQQPAQQQGASVHEITQQVRQQLMQELQQQREHHSSQKASQEATAFGEGREHFEDVREDMADVLQSAARRGVAMSLEEAYNRACKLHPDVSAKLERAQKLQAVKAAAASTQRSKAAASSIRGQPAAPPSAAKSVTSRDDIEAAWEQLTSR